ncbi:ribonuclease H-like domain-containing protein [Candidatus Uhrbacteria bacterium]|nr:ribonuclease H-like domain-containing protein [Candidatus Uhrbacteria bacterium]
MERILVFDIETQKEFAEVGGAHNRHLLGVAVIGCYDSGTDTYLTFEEKEVLAFGKLLRAADLVIGFNSEHFDLPVLQPYLPFDTSKVPSLDLMKELERHLGHRVSLDSCAEATLQQKKSGDGLQAIRWFREGKIDQVKKYCLDDVRITRELYEYGCQHGQVYFMGKDGAKRAVPIAWGSGPGKKTPVRTVLEEALRRGQRVEIEYVSTMAAEGEDHRNRRKIDVLSVHGDVVDAYCHLRKDTRRFAIDRITDIVLLSETTDAALRMGQHALL